MQYATVESGLPTKCRCGFQESAGSLYVLEQLSSVLAEYASLKGLQIVKGIHNDLFTINKGVAFSGNGFLSILLRRSQTFMVGSIPTSKFLSGNNMFALEASKKGLVNERVVFKSPSENPAELKHAIAQQIIMLTFVIDETMGISQSLGNRDSGTLYIEDVVGVREAIHNHKNRLDRVGNNPATFNDNENTDMRP